MENDKCMELIIHSGEAQSYAMEAINQAKNFNFNQAKELMEKAEKEQIEAHKVQTSLIVEMARKKRRRNRFFTNRPIVNSCFGSCCFWFDFN